MLLDRLIWLSFSSAQKGMDQSIAYHILVLNKHISDYTLEEFCAYSDVSRSSMKRFMKRLDLNYKQIQSYLYNEWEDVSLEASFAYRSYLKENGRVYLVSDELLLPYLYHMIKLLLLLDIQVEVPLVIGSVSTALKQYNITKSDLIILMSPNKRYVEFLADQYGTYRIEYRYHEFNQIYIGLKAQNHYNNLLEIDIGYCRNLEKYAHRVENTLFSLEL